MNGNSGVDNLGLDGLLINGRHNSLVDMVVDVLSGHGWRSRLSVVGFMCNGLVLETSHLRRKSLLCG
jgi:hypothetical protein